MRCRRCATETRSSPPPTSRRPRKSPSEAHPVPWRKPLASPALLGRESRFMSSLSQVTRRQRPLLDRQARRWHRARGNQAKSKTAAAESEETRIGGGAYVI